MKSVPAGRSKPAALRRLWLGSGAVALLCAAVPARAEPDLLAEKAAQFRAALLARHVTPEGVLVYEVALSSIERDLAQGTYPVLADMPTHTGIWAATACLQAELGVEPEQARSDAQRALGGLQLLMEVTGVPGLMTRSIRRDAGQDVSGLRGRWFAGGPGYENYRWRGDVSADQYANGLLPAVAACARLFPEQSARLIGRFAAHLAAHDMQLVDADGRRTQYGDLSRFSGLGFNSIYQLTGYGAYALSAAVTGDPAAAARRDELRDRERVVARGRVTNLKVLGITNESNDMMAFHLYRALIPAARRSGDPALADLRHGLVRAWRRVRSANNAYFAATFCALEPQRCDRKALAAARDLLAAFPLEKRRVRPPAALDSLARSWLPGRKLGSRARRWIPIELRPSASFEWKESPYRLDYRDLPDVEYTGLDYLAAYWMLRAAQQIASGGPVPAGL